MTAWILRDVGGWFLCGGRAGDSVWAPKRHEARLFRTKASAQRFADKENALTESPQVKVVKIRPRCPTCGRPRPTHPSPRPK